MSYQIKKVDYFYTSIDDQPGEAYKLLTVFAKAGINLLAITAVPVGPTKTQLTLFPENGNKFENETKRAGFVLDGPYQALLVQGDDELGALAEVHQKLFDVGVNVYASSGVTDGKGNYGYILYLRQEQFDDACKAFDL